MLPVPPKILASYRQLLAQRAIPDNQRPHYLKSLRFYLDFCGKYDHDPSDAATVDAFAENNR